MKLKTLLPLFLALLLCISAAALAEETEELYVENQWNYVENSMDVSHGIPEDAAGALERIRLRGKLLVAMEPYFPPQEFLDFSKTGQAQFVGADVELAKRIAERMGVELEIVPMEFSQVLFAVADGECDLAISALAYTPSRAVMMTLSRWLLPDISTEPLITVPGPPVADEMSFNVTSVAEATVMV